MHQLKNESLGSRVLTREPLAYQLLATHSVRLDKLLLRAEIAPVHLQAVRVGIVAAVREAPRAEACLAARARQRKAAVKVGEHRATVWRGALEVEYVRNNLESD